MIDRVKLREQYKEETGEHWKMLFSTAQPTVEYVKWLEDKLVKNCSIPVVMPSLEYESKTKDDMLLEILSPLGTEIADPTGEYADLFAYLYDKISPIIRNEA